MKFQYDRVILFGGGDSLLDLAIWLKSKSKEVLVFTSTRHSKDLLFTRPGNLKESLLLNEINFTITDELTEKLVKNVANKSIGISFGSSWIFKKPIIDLFNGQLLNSHGSPLPEHRGGGGFSWRILMGDDRGNSLLHLIDEGIDTGDIVYESQYCFPSDECVVPKDFYLYSFQKYNTFIQDFFLKVDSGYEFGLKKQYNSSSTYWPRLNTEKNGIVNWNWSASQIKKFINAFDDPYMGVGTYVNNVKFVRLKRCIKVIEQNFHPFQCGLVFRKEKINDQDSIFIAAKDGYLIVQEVLCQEKKIINDIRLGDRFFTPSTETDKALEFRPVYNSLGLK